MASPAAKLAVLALVLALAPAPTRAFYGGDADEEWVAQVRGEDG